MFLSLSLAPRVAPLIACQTPVRRRDACSSSLQHGCIQSRRRPRWNTGFPLLEERRGCTMTTLVIRLRWHSVWGNSGDDTPGAVRPAAGYLHVTRQRGAVIGPVPPRHHFYKHNLLLRTHTPPCKGINCSFVMWAVTAFRFARQHTAGRLLHGGVYQ